MNGFNRQALQQRRKELRFTQEDLAIMLDVGISAISNWESGHSEPELTNFARLVEVLEVDPDELRSPIDELQGVADYRRRAGLSQREAADRIDVGLGKYRGLERGLELPREDEVEALARAFGAPADEIRRLSKLLYDHRRNTRP